MSTRVMIIDDDEDTLKLMRVLLEAKGYQVRTYRQPESAFAALDLSRRSSCSPGSIGGRNADYDCCISSGDGRSSP